MHVLASDPQHSYLYPCQSYRITRLLLAEINRGIHILVLMLTVLPYFHCGQLHHIPFSCVQIPQPQALNPTLFLCLFMPPRPSSTNLPRIESSTVTTGFGHLVKILLLLSIFTIVFRSLVLVITRRKRRMPNRSPSQVKNALPTPPALDKEPNQYLQSLKQETLRPDLRPIYPWVSPPQPLPGPYDAPYYPLPVPTIRRHSFDSSDAETEEKAEEISRTVSYVRRVSMNSIPTQEHILEGSSISSTHGWRRTQWTVSAG